MNRADLRPPAAAAPPEPYLERFPYFFQDPIRLLGIACASLLVVLPEIPIAVAAVAVGVSQANAIVMLLGYVEAGWSRRWNRRSRSARLTHSMTRDWTNTSLCTLVGATLLIRIFGPRELSIVLGLLALAVALLPDIRPCRFLLSSRASTASVQLDRGFFLQDPVKMGGLLSLLILCLLDRTSLMYLFLSMALLQFNALLILVEKYITEIHVPRPLRRHRSAAVRLLLAREGQRLLITIMPVGFVGFRLLSGDVPAFWAAGAAGGLLVLSDTIRLARYLLARLRNRLRQAWTRDQVPRFRVKTANLNP
ncbi:MAG: hypothetical protein HY716_06955 [Planctomycetes bacterium]|nr:hypothetical protein [Planctomycetota bacterium]